MHRRARWLPAVALAALLGVWSVAVTPGAPAARAARTRALPACPANRWNESWYAAPSDADSAVDASLKTFTHGPDETFRMIITPHYGGSLVRIRLSNAYGTEPVTISDVSIAKRLDGAALVPNTSVPVLFDGQLSVTIPAGGEAVSDPAEFSFRAFEDLAVSMYVPGGELPTEHFIARQTSYGTLPMSGDDVSDDSATPFVQSTTAWYFLTGLDVRAPGDAGTVVTFGDSITDGYQGTTAAVVPQVTSTLNLNARYPDFLARRILAAGLPLSVANAGISGNRILQGGLLAMFGVSGIARFQRDAIDIPGASTIIILEGANDLGQSSATAQHVIDGLTQLVDMAKAAGIPVLLGTLTPMGNAKEPGYSGAAVNAKRVAINDWIETQTIANGYVDFAQAVADPSDPEIINPPDDGGDGLHFSPAGYQALADAVNLSQLQGPACSAAQPELALSVSRQRVPAGRRVRLRIRVSAADAPVAHALVRLNGQTAVTDGAGRTSLSVRFAHPGHYRLSVTAAGDRSTQTTITVTQPSQ